MPPQQKKKSAKSGEQSEPISDAQFNDLTNKLDLIIKLHEQLDTVYKSVEENLQQGLKELDTAVQAFATRIKHAEARKEKFHLTDRQCRACARLRSEVTQELERIEAWVTKSPKPMPAIFSSMQEFHSTFDIEETDLGKKSPLCLPEKRTHSGAEVEGDVDEDEYGMSAPFCIAFMFSSITDICSSV